MKIKQIIISISFILSAFLVSAQTGIINNGAKIVVSNGAVIRISGSSLADYTNKTSGAYDGRIDLDGVIKIEGDWYNNATSGNVLINVNNDGEVQFIGSLSQIIGGSAQTSFEKLLLNNNSGIVLNNSVWLYDDLTFTNGLLTLGSNNLTLGISTSIIGTPSSSKMFVASGSGELRKIFNSTGSFTFPVGENVSVTEYSPITLNFTSGSFGGSSYAAVNLTNTKHSNNSSTVDYLNRYWSVNQSGISNFSCDVTCNYTTADVNGTESNIYGAMWDSPNWTKLNAVNTASNQITGTVSSFSDFTGAELSVVEVAIVIDDDGLINEGSEEGEIISVTLTNDDFVSTLNPAYWTVNNLPQGVTKGDVSQTDSKHASIQLNGNRTKDYDTDITNVEVVIDSHELTNLSTGNVSVNTGVLIDAFNDEESIEMTNENIITEGAEDGAEISVTLTGGTFTNSITQGNWTLTNLPDGVSKGTVTRTSATTATITLSGNCSGDYDTDITNLTLNITEDEVDDYTGDDLTVNTGVTFTAIDENMTITLTNSGITEGGEDGEIITVDLGGSFSFVTTLNTDNWIVSNLPQGVSKGTLTRVNNTQATITLSGNRTKDYDANITNLTVQIAQAEIIGAATDGIGNTGVTFTAINDIEELALDDGTGISESSEDGSEISVTLSGGTFVSTLNKDNWNITNLPEGVTIGSVSKQSLTEATIILSGNRNVDYDTNDTLRLAVNENEIDDHTGDSVVVNEGAVITAYIDDESIAMSNDADGITEGAEDGEVITVTLTGGTFIAYIEPSNWTLTNLPEGVSKGDVVRTSSTTATINLSGNCTGDYDANIIDLTLNIADTEVDDYSGDDLTINTGVTFTAIDEQPILAMSDNGIYEELEDGEIITVAIKNKIFHSPINADNWILSNLPQGVSKGTVTRLSDDTVTVALSGNRTKDYDADITDLSLQIMADQIDEYSSDINLYSGVLFKANNYEESIEIDDDGLISEGAENGEKISITLIGGTFTQTLNSDNWTLTNLPEGVSKGALIKISSTTATIELSGNCSGDYDTDITDLTLTVTDDQIDDYSGTALSVYTGVKFTAIDEQPVIVMSDNGINESFEDGEIIKVAIKNKNFHNPINFENWVLTNLPEGVSKGAVTLISEDTVTIALSGNRTADYDTDISDLNLYIDASEIDYYYSNVNLNTGVLFAANNDEEIVTMSDDGFIVEGAENDEIITVHLSGGTFANNIDLANWTLTNLPEGVAKGELVRVSDTIVTISLNGNSTVDYDEDITDLTLNIIDAEVDDYDGIDLVINTGVTFKAIAEGFEVTMSYDGLIEEGDEDGEIITVKITNVIFNSILDTSNWILSNLPVGVAGNVSRLTDSTVAITLSGNRIVDYDSDINDFTVQILQGEIINYSTNCTIDEGVVFTAQNDIESISMTDNGNINEGAEDGRIITVSLSGGTFVNSFNSDNWILANLPEGVSKGKIIITSDTIATIELNGNRTVDYDNDIADLTLTIKPEDVDDCANDILANTGVIFVANNEIANISVADSLTEGNLDGAEINLSLSNEMFIDTLLETTNFVLNNAPLGTSMEAVTYVDNSNAVITLAFDGTNFDSNITDFNITVIADELFGIADVTSNNLIITTTTSIDINTNNDIVNIYSSDNNVYIKISENIVNKDAYVSIYNIIGEKILHKKLNKTELNIINIDISNNCYLVSVRINNKIFKKKVFINKK